MTAFKNLKPVDRVIFGMLAGSFSIVITVGIVCCIAAIVIFNHYTRDLPDYGTLAEYDPPIATRLYAADGRFMAEYATEKRLYVPLNAIPKRVINAFLSAEDKNFYQHTGVDFTSLLRAAVTNLNNFGEGRSLVGGSTITQQVVKNFLLTSEKSIERKMKEAILALRITQTFSKDRILELYLNDIYLGLGSYGVAAAALNYFNKPLDELTVEEAALLAAQPKAPANYNPKKNYDAAKERRDYVIGRMVEDGYLSKDEGQEAMAKPIVLRTRDVAEVVRADFFAEEVRRKLADMYGSNILYEGGLSVKTTLDPVLQLHADKALRKALIEYDRRRGFRGPVTHFDALTDYASRIAEMETNESIFLLEGQKLAVVMSLEDKMANIGFSDGKVGNIPVETLGWTRRVLADGVLGPEIKKPADVLAMGDVVIAETLPEEERKELAAKKLPEKQMKAAFRLAQIPEVNGAMVVMDPHTGRVLALSGGYSYGNTEFNRVTQAKRQPGSAFKPFAYLVGLENGFTPSTILLDAPVEQAQGEGLPIWKPQNYKDEYLGPTTLRVGLEKSRNTMTVRLAQMVGVSRIVEVGKRFGVYDNPPVLFSLVLGASETTLIRLTNAYCMLVNGGRWVTPAIIERIDDRRGHALFRRDGRVCPECLVDPDNLPASDALPPMPADDRPQVVDPRVAYQMVSMLQGVVDRGTAARARSLNRPLAGKTGTTNDSMDTWFIGFSPDLVVGTYIGYDKPRTLGKKETGGSVALPAFIAFMGEALKGKPSIPFRIPRGVQLMRVDLHTGEPILGEALEGEKVILEAFIAGEPIWRPDSALQVARGGEAAGPPLNAAGAPIMDGTATMSHDGTINAPLGLFPGEGNAGSSGAATGTGGLY